MEELKKNDINCMDIMVYDNKWNKREVIVTLKMEDYQNTSGNWLNKLIRFIYLGKNFLFS